MTATKKRLLAGLFAALMSLGVAACGGGEGGGTENGGGLEDGGLEDGGGLEEGGGEEDNGM